MKKNNNHLFSDLLFFVPLACLFFLSHFTYFNLTSDTDVFGYYAYLEFFSFWRSLKPIFLLLLIIKIYFYSGYSVKQLTAIGLALIVIFCLCSKYHPNYFLLFAVASCFAAKNVAYCLIAKVYYYLSLCTLALTFFFLACGLLVDNTIQRGEHLRHSFGLVHPNSFGMWSLLIIIYFIQYKQISLKNYHFVVLAFQAITVYIFSNSRASFFLSIMVIALSFLFTKANHRMSQLALSFLLIAAISLAFIWLLLCYCYDSQSVWITSLDQMVSGRIRFSHNALNDWPPNIFGNNVTFSYPVDPLFTYTLIIYGYFGLATFLSMFYIGIIRTFRKSLPFVMVAFLAFQIYNTQENVFLYHLFDLTLFTVTCDLD